VRFPAAFVVTMLLAAAGSPALACSPPPDYVENFQRYEDRELLRATVLYRGVVENVRQDAAGETILNIRRVRTFWGQGAPSVIRISTEYFAQCARGNLHYAVQETDEPSPTSVGGPRPPEVRNGLGVTVLGRPEDVDLPSNFTILVDRFGDTQRVLARFRELKEAQ